MTLPILPQLLTRPAEMLLATNPQFSPVSCEAGMAPATSPQSSPIGAPSFKLDGYGSPVSPMSPMSDGRGSKAKHRQRARPEPKSNGETTTLMIRNLPFHLTQTELLNELNKLGLSKLYDFCYLPRDFNVAESKGSLAHWIKVHKPSSFCFQDFPSYSHRFIAVYSALMH